MSILITTPFGKLRAVEPYRDEEDPTRVNRWIWECPVCELWGGLSDRQIAGDISINCAAHGLGCTYHETHDFRGAITAAGHDPMHNEGGPVDPDPAGSVL